MFDFNGSGYGDKPGGPGQGGAPPISRFGPKPGGGGGVGVTDPPMGGRGPVPMGAWGGYMPQQVGPMPGAVGAFGDPQMGANPKLTGGGPGRGMDLGAKLAQGGVPPQNPFLSAQRGGTMQPQQGVGPDPNQFGVMR